MELLRRFHVLLELCHALDRLLLRVREADAFGKRDGGNPHQLAGAQRVLLAQSDGRQGTDAALAADLLDPGRAAFGRRDQLVAAILFVEENLFGFDGLRLEDLHTAERMRGIRRLVDDALNARHRSEEHTSELQSLMRISYAV